MHTLRALRVSAVNVLRSLDPALLLIPLIGLVAVWPLLTESLPSTDDGALHMLRLAEIERSLRHGVLPLRWAPDFAHGYGYPFFNYYASLSSYIAVAWRLLGLNIPQAIAAATVMAIWASGWGTYLLGRAMYGPKGGLVAAAAYMVAPYQFYDSAYRGNLAETWALALLPWVLWAGRRAFSAPPRRRWAAIASLAVAYAALIYTHNVYALISSPVLGLYLLLLWWIAGIGMPAQRSRSVAAISESRTVAIPRPDEEMPRHALWKARLRRSNVFALGRSVAGIALGLALSAFFWLPAFGERGWTHFSTGLVDYRTFFLDLGELLAWPPQVDLALLNYYPPRSLNWGMLALIGGGVVTVVGRLRRVWRPTPDLTGFGKPVRSSGYEVTFFAIVLVGTAFLTLRASDLLWRTVPLLGYALIPWRFLGIASLAGSVVAGATIALLPEQYGRNRLSPAGAVRPYGSPALLGTCVAIALVVAAAVPWTYATPVGQRTEYGVADIVGWEYSSKLIGTTAKNEFLPIWSSRLPPEPADPALLTETDPIIARLDESSLPDGARVISADYGLMRAELVIDTPRAFRALYKQLYFPGWRVTIDGREAAQIATAPYGLLGFEVPAGRHRIVVHPTTTPLRLAGSLVSGLALAVIVVGCGLRVRPSASAGRLSDPRACRDTGGQTKGTPVDAGTPDRYHADDRRSAAFNGVPKSLPWSHGLAVAVLALLLLLVKEGWIDCTENLFRARRYDPGAPVPVSGAEVATAVNFGDAFTLHGYTLPRRAVPSGEPLRVDLYLGARRPPEARAGEGPYMAYARLVDDEGRLWSLPYNGAPEGHRPPPTTTIWPTDAYGHWAYLVYTLPGTPPGSYWIQVGLFEWDTWRGLNVLDDAGRIAGLSAQIGPVEIARPGAPPAQEALAIERPSAEVAAPGLRYLGSTVDVSPRRAGDEVGLTLFWQAAGRPAADYALRLTWKSGETALLLGEGLPPGRREHPTGEWVEGEVVRSPHRLRVPVSAPAGAYRIEAIVTDRAGQPAAAPMVVAEGTLEPTDRQMALPQEVRRRVDADLGEQVTLTGYDLLDCGPDAPARVARGGMLPVTLYWQAQREMAASYKVFVQLVGATGVLAQSDAVPANWQRPTAGWMPGEVIVDEHVLSIPADASPGDYTLIAGMYDEETLQRLAVLDTRGTPMGDAVTLEGVVVE